LIPPQLKKTVSFEETDENVVSKQQPVTQDQIDDTSSEKSIENTSNADFNPFSSTPKINVKFASTDTDDDENEIAQPIEDVFEQTVIPPTHATFYSDNMDISVLSEPDLQYEENVEFAQLLSEGTILSGYVAPGKI
jgi:LPS O-antigen subunit length determinant protein (WzzB/FepE family)